MRIVFVAPSAYRLGGVQTWLSYLLPGLVSEGFEPLLALVEGDWHDVDAYLSTHPFAGVLRISPRQFTPSGRRRAIAEVVGDLEPAIAVGVNIADLYPASVDLATKGKRSRIVASQHAIQADYFADLSLFRSAIDAVICTNRLTQKLCHSLAGIGKGRVLYAPCGVAEHVDHRAGRLGHDRTGPLCIGYAGRIEDEQKRASDLPNILNDLVRAGCAAELVVAGDGPQVDSIRAQFSARKLDGRVAFLGHVPSQQMARAFYERIDVLLITSRWETGPIVAWEAMAHRVPVVSSAYIGSVAEGALVDGLNCLLFPVGNSATAAVAVRRLMNQELRNRIIANGLELVRRRYTQSASVRQWASALRRVTTMPYSDRRGPDCHLHADGRLSRWMGGRAADLVRECLLPRKAASSAGSEWPHAYSTATTDAAFWAHASDADARSVATVSRAE